MVGVHLVPSQRLGVVQRAVGGRDKRFAGIVVGGTVELDDAEARADLCADVGGERADRLQRHPQPFGQLGGAVQVGVGQQHRELLAADTGEHVGVAQVTLDGPCRGLQDAVSGQMPEAVVYLLEPVEIEQRE